MDPLYPPTIEGKADGRREVWRGSKALSDIDIFFLSTMREGGGMESSVY